MVHFMRLPQLRLSLSLCLDFGTSFSVLILGLKFWTEVQDCPVAVLGRICGLSMACFWLGFDLDLDSLGARSEAILCSGGGMFMWHVMVVCVDCFVGISYAIIGLQNQIVFAWLTW